MWLGIIYSVNFIVTQVSFFTGIPDTYQFLDANGWPVSKHLEKATRVGEVTVVSCVVVCTDLLAKSQDAVDKVDEECSHFSSEPSRKKLKGFVL